MATLLLLMEKETEIGPHEGLIQALTYLLSVARKAMISAAILQHKADLLCDDEHLVLTRWPLVFFTTEGSSESEKNQI